MKTRDLLKIGIPAGCADTAKQILQKAQALKQSMRSVSDDLKKVAETSELNNCKIGTSTITVTQ